MVGRRVTRLGLPVAKPLAEVGHIGGAGAPFRNHALVEVFQAFRHILEEDGIKRYD